MTVRARLTWPLIHLADRARRPPPRPAPDCDGPGRGHPIAGPADPDQPAVPLWRPGLMHRGGECDNLDHVHYTQRFGQVLADLETARRQIGQLQRLAQDQAAVIGDLRSELAVARAAVDQHTARNHPEGTAA